MAASSRNRLTSPSSYHPLLALPTVRQEAQPTPESSTLSSSSLLTRLLSRPLPASSLDSIEYSSQLSQHREAITASLGASLKRVGEKVGAMQEARGRARLAREGKRVQVGARNRTTGRRQEEERKAGKAVMGSTASFRALAATSAGLPPSSSSSSSHQQQQQQAPAGEEEELTPSQLQLFQSESSSLTKSLQADLSALESVTSTLSTISSLQSTLIQHLSTQNETIGALVGEAGEQRVEVKRGNEQLKKARERNRSANRLLGALLVGSGLGLLFLHGESEQARTQLSTEARVVRLTPSSSSLLSLCTSHGLKPVRLVSIDEEITVG